jgi:serine/threonine protein kinase/Flp pilus assembly protein TadD
VENLGNPVWIGHYRLTSRIATGGMAEVYVGRHIDEQGHFGPMVAVKKLLPHLVKDSAIVRMFLNEARITAQIEHPNVVRIHELGQVAGEPFIAMELLEGRTFADLRTRAAEDGKRVPLPIALRILAEACRGLAAAHEAKDDQGNPLALVHRDFTPDNIHVGVKGDIKVIDFGIAKTANWGSGTEPGTLKGKFFYMSPEMILAKPVDRRADVFAAGVMLYEQMCGRRPFTGNSIDEVVMKIAEGKPPPPSQFDPSLPAALEAVCLTALNKTPESRFQTMGDFVDAIEAVGGEVLLASFDEVATYVSHLFPQTDKRRQTLRRAREADPSVPNLKPGELAMSPPFGMAAADDLAPEAIALDDFGTTAVRPSAPSRPILLPEPPIPEPEPPTAQGVVHRDVAVIPRIPPLSPVEPRTSTARPPPRWGLVLLGLLALGASTVGGVVLFSKNRQRSAEELLAAASRAETSELKGRALAGIERSPEVTEEQLRSAVEILVSGSQWPAVEVVSEAWGKKNSKSLDAHLARAKAAIQLRKGRIAETAIAEASALAPNDHRPDVLYAELREVQGDAPGALEGWTRAARKNPQDAHILSRRGYWLSQSGRLDEASEVLNQVLKRRFDPEAAAELGFVLSRKEQTIEALKLLARAVKEKPDLMVGHYYRATVLYQRGDFKAARAAYLEADRLAGEDNRPLVALCQMEVQVQSSNELDDAKKRIRERFPNEADKLIASCAP